MIYEDESYVFAFRDIQHFDLRKDNPDAGYVVFHSTRWDSELDTYANAAWFGTGLQQVITAWKEWISS